MQTIFVYAELSFTRIKSIENYIRESYDNYNHKFSNRIMILLRDVLLRF